MAQVLRIAIQKSGRLSEKSLEIIKKCGIKFGSDERAVLGVQQRGVWGVVVVNAQSAHGGSLNWRRKQSV